VIDLADLVTVSKHRWHLDKKGYPVMRINGKRFTLHRFLKGSLQDHIDRDPTNNKRDNLRDCTISQNNANQRIRIDNSTGYKGVSQKYPNRWQATIQAKGVQKYLGLYESPEKAALAYNKAALEHFGGFALLNELKTEPE
jgi:hypothetical protein